MESCHNEDTEIASFSLGSNRLLMLLPGDYVTLKPCWTVSMLQGCIESFSQSICDGVGIKIIYHICRFVQPCNPSVNHMGMLSISGQEVAKLVKEERCASFRRIRFL